MIKFSDLSVERPVGSDSNERIIRILKKEMEGMKFETVSLPFECMLWSKGESFVSQGEVRFPIHPSPFSARFEGKGRIRVCSTVSDLDKKEHQDTILILRGDLTRDPLMPKGFPFYFPDEHKLVYEKIEALKPQCIIAVTGKHSMSGLDPFPLFEDGNFKIPSAYVSDVPGLERLDHSKEIEVLIDSRADKRKSEQPIFRKKGRKRGTILVCAHMDSKYGTKGALDNAAGVFTLLEIAKKMEGTGNTHDIEIAPFNGEEYYGVSGQMEYLKYLGKRRVELVVNIDAAGNKGSKNALSFYNLDAKKVAAFMEDAEKHGAVKGREWYSSDHALFVFKGVPCIVATSSNLFENAMSITHTDRDVESVVDVKLLKSLASLLVGVVKDPDNTIV